MEHGIHEFGKYLPNPATPTTIYWKDDSARIGELERKVAALEDLLKRAKQYDIDNNEPDCELNDKKALLEKIAMELGVKITIP